MEIGIISWMVVGLIARALGKLIMPGDDPGRFPAHDRYRDVGRSYRRVGDDAAWRHWDNRVQRLVDPGGYFGSGDTSGSLRLFTGRRRA